MPNINDFKLIGIKSLKYFDLLANELDFYSATLTNCQKERFGFYLYMLENLCDEKEILDLADLVTDTEFNRILFDEKFEDHGIDAVQIDEENFNIYLFNFKYHETFKPTRKQSINDTFVSTKFINALLNEDVNQLEGKLKVQARSIIKKLQSKEIWKLHLYVVSNDNIELKKEDNDIEQLANMYDLEITSIGLSQISQIMSIRPDPIDAEIIVNNDAIMSFSESTISSSKSYILRLPVNEIIRITCDDKILRNEYSIENLSPLSNVNLDYAVLFDNVRGLVLKSKYNNNISKTLREESSKFFMYNNGLTLTASDIIAEQVNAKTKVKLTIKNFQVLNGGQTLRTIHAFNKEDDKNIEDYLSNSEVLVRIFKTTTNELLNNKIAEFTNSQNTISNIDLKSLRTEQIQLEQYLEEKDIIYSRKTGDTGLSNNKKYKFRISMERFGQILFSLRGFPEKASNQKKQIFDKYYDEIFGEKYLDIDSSTLQIERYHHIKKIYENHKKNFESSDQKIFYILYIDKHMSRSIPELIDIFESIIPKFNTTIELSPARKLIRSDFKVFLDKQLSIAT